jgi:hypothetical protein
MPSSNQAPPRLSAEQRARVDQLLDDLFDLPEAQRLTALGDLRLDDSAVAIEVESLLRAAGASGHFLEKLSRAHLTEPDEDAVVGSRIDAWRIVRLIGHGGMGDVYEATRAQGDFDHKVAIKLLQREAVAQLERFQTERQILARLEHPGIARLYDGGVTPDGRPYMVMEYVAGHTLTDFCTLGQAGLERRLTLFIQVCAAVAYAHQNLIVHRDLKPSNILVTAQGAVKLLDFGIAKLLDPHAARVTQAAAPLTLMCAAPEQLTGGSITTATDVYALGLLLYELLTGSHPWIGSETPVLQALRAVLQRPAPAASHAASIHAGSPVPARLIRGDLDAIVAKALRSEAAHRYPTVEALKLDVERVLNGDPIEARKGAHLYVVGRMLRRYRWAVAVLVVGVAGALTVVGWQGHRARIERDSARREESREEAVRHNLTRLFRAALADPGAQSTSAARAIDSSAQLALHELNDQPELAGQIVPALADSSGALEDVTGAASLLEGVVSESNSRIDPAALADARQKLADIELLRGQVDYAAQLLDQADAFWAGSPRPYLEERLEGLVVRSRVDRARGDLDRAIATTRQAIARRVALSGHDHRDTALLYNALAISLTNANRLDEAFAAYHEATAIYQSLGLTDGLESRIVEANTGTLELRRGHLKRAEALLKEAAARERSLAGDSAALAAALGYDGKVLSIVEPGPAALDALRESVAVARRYAGPDSPLILQNLLFLGEAQLAGGDRLEANATLNDVRVAALAQFGAAHPLALRTQVALAQVAAEDGDVDRARNQVSSAIAQLRKMGISRQADLARALEILGAVETRGGRTTQASTALLEAISLREKSSDDSWELAEARERLGEILAQSGSHGAAGLLQQAFGVLESQLGVDHPETVRAKAALARLPI